MNAKTQIYSPNGGTVYESTLEDSKGEEKRVIVKMQVSASSGTVNRKESSARVKKLGRVEFSVYKS